MRNQSIYSQQSSNTTTTIVGNIGINRARAKVSQNVILGGLKPHDNMLQISKPVRQTVTSTINNTNTSNSKENLVASAAS